MIPKRNQEYVSAYYKSSRHHDPENFRQESFI